MEPVKVTIYTDPGCPFGFSAQRQELQLRWHYGHGIDVTPTMIVLSEKSSTFEERGLKPEMIAGNYKRLGSQYGMPMTTVVPSRMAATLPACRAFVGARLFAPERASALLRALRRAAFSFGLALDAPDTLHGAGEEAGIASEEIDAWLLNPVVGDALAADMRATRSPLPEARALAHRMSGPPDAMRYSTASAVFSAGDRQSVSVGFQPFAVYEVAMANVAPALERRPAPGSVAEILDWTPYPLATAEVAELRGISLEDARAELSEAGASFTPAASDGYWSAG